jgi:hypothetical protein
MMEYMLSPQDYELMVQQYDGDVEAANAFLRQRGYAIPGEETSSLAVMDPNMDPDAGDEAPSDLAARPDAGSLSGILAEQRQSIGDLYDKITQNIQQRYRKPDLNDLLVQVGMGMLSPPGEDDEGGFGGAVKRGLRGVGSYAQSLRAYDTDMNKMLSALEIDKAKQMAALQGKYLTGAAAALKPRPRRTAINSRDEVVDLDTAEIIQRPAPKIGATKTGRDGKVYTFTNATGDGDEYNKANWQELR